MTQKEKETIKATFEISKKSKAMLDQFKKEGIVGATLIDTLLQFDEKAADKFLEIFKKQNPEKVKDYNYLRVSSGGLVYGDSVMQKIVNSNISELTDEAAITKGIEIIQETLDNVESIPQTDAKALMERIDRTERALISIHREYKEQRNKLKALEKYMKI